MKESEYLFVCLSEEGSEVAKEALKCVRFTPFHRHSNYPRSNFEKLVVEYAQLQATFEVLINHLKGQNPGIANSYTELYSKSYADKISALEKYTEISRRMGVVDAIAA